MHEDDVCLLARAQEPAVRHAKQPGNAVGHEVGHLFNREQPVVDQIHHGHECVLHQWPP